MAQRKSFVFSEKDIRDIQKEIAKLFTEEAEGQLTINVNELKAEIETIINKIHFIKVYSSQSGKYKGSRISRMGSQKRQLMAEAYLIIFKVRQFLLDEEINYRYYFNTDDGGAKVVEFSEDEILKYMRVNTFGLQILDNVLKKEENSQEYQSLLDLHYQNIMNGLQPASNSSFYVVHSAIMNKYNIMNPQLRKKNNQYQVFTRGHIFEAIDIAFSEAIRNNKERDYFSIESAVFGKYLNYDSIAGTKGGDNAITMTQIKANAADILDYTTIVKDLELILQLLQLKSKDEMQNQIEKLYMDKDKYETLDAFNSAADRAVDKLLSLLDVQST